MSCSSSGGGLGAGECSTCDYTPNPWSFLSLFNQQYWIYSSVKPSALDEFVKDFSLLPKFYLTSPYIENQCLIKK